MASVAKQRRRCGPRPVRQLSSTTNPKPSPRRKCLTFYDKVNILDYCHSNPHLKQSDIAQHFQAQFPKITQATISRYLSQEEEIRRYVDKYPERLGYARPIHVAQPVVEHAISEWVNQNLSHGRVHLSGRMICQKARQFSDDLVPPDGQHRSIKFSSGWLNSFKERMGLHRVWYHGEAASAPLDHIEPEVQRLNGIVAPDNGLSNRLMSGVKMDMARLTFGLCTNVKGTDKRPPFVLGKVHKPRCFKGRTGPQLGFDYDNNSSGWMNEIMWLAKFDADMRRQNRHVLLLCDNASSHKKPKPGQYPNVRVEFLAPRLTAFIQPLDAGIIRCFKAHYRRLQVQRAINRPELGESKIYHVNVLEGLQMAYEAWSLVSPATIVNCWCHTGICPPGSLSPEGLNAPDSQDASLISSLQVALDQVSPTNPASACRFVDLDESVPTEAAPSEELIVV
ncbi:tigger transposable element-derived protein [Ceratobasidium sp. AG-Ba]|nr:tigger transposable element-derived protein [Ceratobasidium sp. AG-Ba]